MNCVPIYEFECADCGNCFEDLVGADVTGLSCPCCGGTRARRLLSPVAPPTRQPRGPGVRGDESRRREREAARSERLAETKRKRAAGER
jgi:putative FmdB family regulatory protein